jgi:replicative DNA helicase
MDDYADFVNAMATARSGVGEPWEEPTPFSHSRDVPVFPAHRFPPWLDDYCVAVAIALQVPVDLPAMLALTVLAAAAGGRCVAQVKPGWIEPLNLYGAIAMPPGSRKTPVFQRLIAPLETAERQAIEKMKPDIIEARVRQNAAKAKAEKAEQEAGRATEAAIHEAIHYASEMRQMAEAITVPDMPRLIADDATPEALASLLYSHGGRLAVFSDEGEVFGMMAGRYSGTPNLAVYLKGHVGSPLRVDRKGRDPEYVERPALTLGLTIQPSVLEALPGIEGARGRGLLGRFLWSVPPSNIGFRQIRPPAVPTALEDFYVAEIVALVHSLAEWVDDPAVLVFKPEASERIACYQEELEQEMKPTGRLGHIADWAAKLAGHTARIAGLLHLAENVRTGWAENVTPATVDDAIAIAQCLTTHALVAFETMKRGQEIADAEALLRWIVGSNRDRFSMRDAYRSNKSRFGSPDLVKPSLELLEQHGYIRSMPAERSTERGRPKSPRYIVNPLIPTG